MDWSVATTHPNCEAVAARSLDLCKVTTYHPRFRDGVRRDGTPRLSTLFPGYLFVDARPPSWRDVLCARGVTGVLGLGEGAQPHVIRGDGEVMSDIRAQEGPDGSIVLPEKFRAGVPVRVGWGSPLFGREGICGDMVGADRVWVLFRVMEREVRINFKKADLELA